MMVVGATMDVTRSRDGNPIITPDIHPSLGSNINLHTSRS